VAWFSVYMLATNARGPGLRPSRCRKKQV